ncbi:hypothetical protein E7T06_15145 [Deinococcus sp. Arct2-2]|uniref:hypothetical protein n=1 Tax=Deinococcus sp. Arct2-2 TaxID=2568653 RepID=UPI0010A30FCE|nr:hypothetical protein [Deinococcus sp. Arct2-2]THF68703.1 hypothetical protein E7T06_15145 [Deinococcus sp. Arct2-2]
MLTTLHHLCLEDFLATRGAAFAPRLIPLPYDTAFALKKLPQGTYIFADLERLSCAELSRAAWLWQQLALRGNEIKLLNHPTRVKQRFELLRALRAQGHNDFDVYRLDEHRVPVRFPVFVRSEHQHNAVVSGLIPDAAALEAFLQQWREGGQSVGDSIITEFCGEADERGLYRRYAAFKVGERIIPTDIFFGYGWEVRGMARTFVVDEHTLAAETAYLHGNPHETQLREVFATAQIDYGRVDYGIVNGRIQVYEINTNPYIAASPLGGNQRADIYEHFSRHFLAALEALDSPSHPALLPLQTRPVAGQQWQWVKQTLYSALWKSGPSHHYAQRLRQIRELSSWGRKAIPRNAKKA